VIDQMVTAYARARPGAQAYYWRTSQCDEVDLLMDFGARRVPFEIKLHSAPGADETKSLLRCMEALKLERGYVLYPGRESYSLGNGMRALSASEVLSDPRALAKL